VTAEATKKAESRSSGLLVVPCVPASDLELVDQDLVNLLRARDARGFDGAYERYANRIFGFLARLARSRVVAEDLFQYTFLRLAERGPSLRADSDLRAWLFSVARNAFYSHARLRKVAARGDSVFEPADSGVGPESGLIMNELESALARLTAEDRELLLLVGVEGWDPREVAALLQVDPVTLRKRLSRARARLADMLDTTPAHVRKSEREP
jgi:RNA polymerase sigma-70 factor (ECF subfamily)